MAQITTNTRCCATCAYWFGTRNPHRRLVPEYCEVTLKTRYAQDDNVSRMYDLILSNIVYDPGEIFSDLLGSPGIQFYEVIFRNEPNWASKVASMKENLQNLMDSIVNAG